jgi:cytochrome c553
MKQTSGRRVTAGLIRPSARRALGRLSVLIGVIYVALGSAASVPQIEYSQVLSSPRDVTRGQALFAPCGRCHGANGGGSSDGLIPAIAGQHFEVLTRQLLDYRYSKRWDPRMESVASGHLLPDAAAIAAVAAYVSVLPHTAVMGLGDGEHAAYGGQVYRRLCAGCHGAGGEGNAAHGVPRIAGQHYAYLLRQMYDAVDNRRPNFSAEHVQLLKRFQYVEFMGVADYVARLGLQ